VSRRDRRQGLAPDAGDSTPRTVLGFAPPPSSQDASEAPESPLAGGLVGATEESAARVDDPPAPPVARFRARSLILHSGRRFDAGSEIPAEVAREMIACGLRVGSEIFKG
jgi:hypothetical protein